MRDDTRQRLLDISARFYERHGSSFDATRNHPWPGWAHLWESLREVRPGFSEKVACLDAGCGNGRFADFLGERCSKLRYVGVDVDPGLLRAAKDRLKDLPSDHQSVAFRRVDLVVDDKERVASDAPFDLVVLFGVLHHIPDEVARLRLLTNLREFTRPGGILAASIWRLDRDTERFARKAVPWPDWNAAQPAAERIVTTDLDLGDALLSWSGDRSTPRYCHFPTDAEIERMAAQGPEMELVERFEADGPTGRDNLYLIWRRRDPTPEPCYPPDP